MWSCNQYGEVWSLGVSVVNIEGCGPPEVGQQCEEATVCLEQAPHTFEFDNNMFF